MSLVAVSVCCMYGCDSGETIVYGQSNDVGALTDGGKSEGDNTIGRRQPGAPIEVPIETADRSMDRHHCIINVRRNKQNELIYTLRDAQSLTGTFLNNEILGDKDRVRIEDGAIVTIGATTFILRAAGEEV